MQQVEISQSFKKGSPDPSPLNLLIKFTDKMVLDLVDCRL